MQIESSDTIPGLKVITPPVFRDHRGEYVMTFSTRTHRFTDLDGRPIEFVEDDVSISRRHVLRGLHGDARTWKLIQCLHGAFRFVVVDMRPDSPGYRSWQAWTLDDRDRRQVLVPAGCANGHLVLTDRSVFSYKQSHHYDGPDDQFTVRWDDPDLAIDWPAAEPILSDRDRSAPFIRDWR